jgi:hypothetical protein
MMVELQLRNTLVKLPYDADAMLVAPHDLSYLISMIIMLIKEDLLHSRC